MVSEQRRWKCLSVRQPYAWAIMQGAKDVENRTQMSYYVGRLYIHVSQKEETDRIEDCVRRVARRLGVGFAEALEDYRRHDSRGRGVIIGSVHMLGCARHHESEWFEEGMYGYLLRDPKPLRKPISCKGSPGFFYFTP